MALMARAVSMVDQRNWRCTQISGGDASKPPTMWEVSGGADGWRVRISVGIDANTLHPEIILQFHAAPAYHQYEWSDASWQP